LRRPSYNTLRTNSLGGDEGKLGLLTAKDEDLKSVFGADFFADIYILSIDQSVFWVESLVGFHIIRVNNRLEGEQLALNDLFISGDITLFEIIKNYLLEQKRNTVFSQAYNKLIANLRKEAIITRLSL
jgi:parvulin-like peptidyl-prolyl isomerase